VRPRLAVHVPLEILLDAVIFHGRRGVERVCELFRRF
jgi:hypothetical protein